MPRPAERQIQRQIYEANLQIQQVQEANQEELDGNLGRSGQ